MHAKNGRDFHEYHFQGLPMCAQATIFRKIQQLHQVFKGCVMNLE